MLGQWKLIGVLLATLAVGVYIATLKGELRHSEKETLNYSGLYRSEQLAHQATIANYRLAAKQAEADDVANKVRVERDQAVISNEVSHDYQTRLAALRGRYDALRLRGASPAASGPGEGAGLPGAGQGAGGADAAAGEEGLSLDDRLICSTQAEQLDALISWVERQTAVPVGP